MKNLLKKDFNISRKFIILFVIMNFLIIGLYYTYSIFVIKQLKDDISLITVRNNVIVFSSSELINNSVTVDGNSAKDVIINLYNPSEGILYYRIMHEGVSTGVSVSEKYHDNSSWGNILPGTSTNSVITISNTNDEAVSVKFIVQESISEYFDKDIGMSYVNVDLNYDHSGANPPSLPNNMIPVYYEAGDNPSEEGVWKKADVNNTDSNYIWYDYDNFMWANAVTVSEDNRSTYINALPGTEILSSDINAFFVWIPKYKYYIISGDGNTSYERLINVNFLNRNDVSSVGTVTCIESISNDMDKHLYSEICQDSTYGSIQNNLSTYFHPSFLEDDDGFWIGKFANSNTSNYTIKANSTTTTGNDILISSVREMINVNNIYGFRQNSHATYDGKTWDYLNGNEDLNAHPITSMEWGAVAILANSAYGKSGNSLYYTDNVKGFTRIYNNTDSNYTGRSTNYTTSSTTITNSSTANAYWYDLTDLTHTKNSITYPIGYRGAGASTTGTIYGVYDMAGGNQTFVMGIVMNEDGTTPYAISSDYYTAYSYIPYRGKIKSSSELPYLEVFRLGDGIKEHVRTYSEIGMWQDGSLTLNNTGFMIRGGYTVNGSLFTTQISNSKDYYETFTVLKYTP